MVKLSAVETFEMMLKVQNFDNYDFQNAKICVEMADFVLADEDEVKVERKQVFGGLIKELIYFN